MKMFNRLRILYFIKQFGESFLFGFLSIFFVNYGFTQSQAGTLMGAVPMVMLISMPLLGLLDDGGKRQKLMVIICMTLVGVLGLLFLIPNRDYLFMLIILIIVTVFRSPIVPALDSLSTVTAINVGRQFSEIRVMASIGYIFAISVGGVLIDAIGYNNVLILGIAFYFISTLLVTAISTPQLDRPINATFSGDRKQLLSNVDFIFFLFVSILTWAPFSSAATFDSVYLNNHFNNASIYGYLDAIRVVFEVLAMLILTKSKHKIPVKWFYVAFSLTVIVKSLAIYFDLPLYALVISFSLVGLGFGTALYYNFQYITQIVRKHNIHIAIFVLNSMQQLFNAIYTYIASAIIKRSVINNISLLYIIVVTVGMLFTIFFMKKQPRDDLNADTESITN